MGLLLVAFLSACTPSRREIDGDMVRRVRFEGNGGLASGHNALQLRGPMAQQQSPALSLTFPFMYFTRPIALDMATLEADARRLEVWYAHHGWFDARFMGWELRRVRQRYDDRAGVVDIIGHVVPGPPSLVRAFNLTGDLSGPAGTVIRGAKRASPLETDRQFDVDEVHQTESGVVESLQDNTYAYATAEAQVDAYPEEGVVDVSLDVQPGISARFGQVEVQGLTRLERDIVTSTLAFRPGEGFRLSKLRLSQRQLFQTELFSLVEIKPDLSDPTKEEVPIRIEVTEARFRRFRVGLGLQYDYFNVSPRGSVSYRDLRLFGSKLQLEAEAGVGAIIGVTQQESASTDVLLTGLGRLRFDYPWFFRRKLGLSFGARFKQDAQFGTLPYWSVTADVGLRYRVNPYITLTFGPTFEYFRYLIEGEDALTAAQLQFGGDFAGTVYRLLALDARLRIDYRDDPIRTRRGSFWGLDIRQSLPIPAFDASTAGDQGVPDGGFLYTRVEAEVRAWWPVRLSKKQKRFPVVMGGRLHGVGLLPWTAGDPLPYPDLAFLGGPNSLRAFRANQVGAYDAVCTYPNGRPNPQHNNGEPYVVNHTYLPKGGAVAIEAMGELRYDWNYGVSFAVFGDVGVLAQRWPDLSADSFRGGGGVGLRYDSPVGPIRLDLGLRPTYPEDRAAASYIGCNPIDAIPNGYDLLTGGQRVRETLGDQGFPVGVNLFLAIGQAF